jgi:phosphatidylinositol alpha-1,6-mannosyltransferase
MRVLFLATDAFGGHGGIAQYNRDFLNGVCSWTGSTEVVAIPRAVAYPPGPLPRKLTYLTDGLNGKTKYASSVVKRLFGEREIDLVIAAHINLLPFAYLASRIFRCPLALLIFGVDAWRQTSRRITNRIASKVDSVVSISNVTLDRFLAWSGVERARTCLIPNAVDLIRLTPGPKSDDLLARYQLNGHKVLMTVGRLQSDDRYKGVDEVLELLPSLSREVPDICYLVIGDGTDRPRLEEKARSLGVAHNVTFAGYIAESDKLAHYRLADAYVMPSSGEGFGFVFLEAMAAGIPVVASKTDGSREAVREGLLGTLVDPGDPEDIRRGILEALNRPRGVVPEGLEYFAYERFEERVHRWLDEFQTGE